SVFYLAFFLTVTPDAVLYTLSYTTLFRSVIVDAHTVHDIGSPGVTHPHQERLVVAAGCGAGSAEETGRGWRAADDHHAAVAALEDRKSTRLNSSHVKISYAVFCLKKKKRK